MGPSPCGRSRKMTPGGGVLIKVDLRSNMAGVENETRDKKSRPSFLPAFSASQRQRHRAVPCRASCPSPSLLPSCFLFPSFPLPLRVAWHLWRAGVSCLAVLCDSAWDGDCIEAKLSRSSGRLWASCPAVMTRLEGKLERTTCVAATHLLNY